MSFSHESRVTATWIEIQDISYTPVDTGFKVKIPKVKSRGVCQGYHNQSCLAAGPFPLLW